MILYHIQVLGPKTNRIMHESSYPDQQYVIDSAKWWIKANLHVRTWVSYN